MKNSKIPNYDLREKAHYVLLQFNKFFFTLTLWICSLIMMAFFGLGLFHIGSGMLHFSDEKSSVLSSALEGLEYLFFAPLPMLLAFAIAKYSKQILPPWDKIKTAYLQHQSNKSSGQIRPNEDFNTKRNEIIKQQGVLIEEAKLQMITVKSFATGLFIAFVVTELIHRILFKKEDINSGLAIISGLILVALLIAYLFVLEYFIEKGRSMITNMTGPEKDKDLSSDLKKE